eukprot:4527588-Heterocapsa_arctica.AAC.1
MTFWVNAVAVRFRSSSTREALMESSTESADADTDRLIQSTFVACSPLWNASDNPMHSQSMIKAAMRR